MECDCLVVGSGIAGLSFALRVAEKNRVLIVTKKKEVDSATNLAQGGIAAVLGDNDSIESHIDDTLRAGDGLCDIEVVRRVVAAGRERVMDLINYGVEFVTTAHGGGLSLGREGGHTHRRVAHANDLTGREIEQALLSQVKKNNNIKMLEDNMVVDLVVVEKEGRRRCVGAYVLDNQEKVNVFFAGSTVLCTGGAGKVYLYTSNPDIATGDGVAIAFRAGAEIANMEFVQFHPTCLYHPQAKNFLISEAVRGEGAILVNRRGERFMAKYDDRLELATRDMVARSIDREMKETGEDCVFLDISMRSADFIKNRFPAIYKKCNEYGIDITVDPIPVVPAAHYLCGGVLVDMWGRTSIEGLLALGETSCTGLHGANRLASNSLLEAVVYAERAARYCARNDSMNRGWMPEVEACSWDCGEADLLEEEVLIAHNWDVIRRIMWNYVGIVRSRHRLGLAKKRLLELNSEIEELYRTHHVSKHMIELRNIAHVALMIVEAALLRRESRGLHHCVDYLDKNDEDKFWIILSRPASSRPWECIAEKNRVPTISK